MRKLTNPQVIEQARTVHGYRRLANDNSAGVCIAINSGIGFYAEHSTIASIKGPSSPSTG